MIKRILAFSFVVILSLSISANAASLRGGIFTPSLEFEGTSAICSIFVSGDSTSDDVSVVLKLWTGGRCVKTWVESGDGYVYLDESAKVVSGQYYTLTADVAINDSTLDRSSTSAKCP